MLASRSVGAAAHCRRPDWRVASRPTAAAQQVIPQIIGFSCLPWANPLHNGRVTRQEREEKEWSGTLKAAYRWNDT